MTFDRSKMGIQAACALLLVLGAFDAARADEVRLFVRHTVADYAAWRQVYDGAAVRALQKQGGVRAQSVWQSADDANDVTVVHDFRSLEAARAFAASPAL